MSNSTIRFWYDMATLSHRYIQYAPTWEGKVAIDANDGTVQEISRAAPMEVSKFSREIREPQDMLDALIAAGFKPNKLEGTPGHVEALEKHIVFAERMADRLLASKVKP